MTPPDPAHTWTWTGNRTLPDWLDRHHHWHTDRPVIHTTDGPRTLYHGWMVILWTDQAITVASTTVAERVYGPDGIAGRLAAAETALARIQAVADEHPAGIDTALIHEALDQPGPATAGHRYLSTGCYHGDHAYCQSMTGLNGAKRPASCKFCQAACQCECHGEARQMRDELLATTQPAVPDGTGTTEPPTHPCPDRTRHGYHVWPEKPAPAAFCPGYPPPPPDRFWDEPAPAGLRARIAHTLRTTPNRHATTQLGFPDHHGPSEGYLGWCALCTRDVDALTEALLAAVTEQPAAHNDGPSIREAAADDRRWPLQKEGQ